MAPREQKVNASWGGNYKRFDTALTPPPTPTPTLPPPPSIIIENKKLQNYGERVIFFRVGALRFGFHGVSGILGTTFVSYALYISHHSSHRNKQQEHYSINLPLWLAIAIVISTLQSSVGSYALLNQVPKSTKITSWIYPPHREAFKRTIAITIYLNIRLIHLWICYYHLFENYVDDDNIIKSKDVNENLLFPIGLLIYTNFNFFPFNFDYSNGNSWVFVLPMFIGLNIDTFQQFPKFTTTTAATASTSSTAEWVSFLYQNNGTLSWDDVHKWNTTKVNETYLLITLLCTLQIAFMFTVAFRGRMNIKFCYWIAAFEVGLLCIRLFRG